jgi:hypothetical protein
VADQSKQIKRDEDLRLVAERAAALAMACTTFGIDLNRGSVTKAGENLNHVAVSILRLNEALNLRDCPDGPPLLELLRPKALLGDTLELIHTAMEGVADYFGYDLATGTWRTPGRAVDIDPLAGNLADAAGQLRHWLEATNGTTRDKPGGSEVKAVAASKQVQLFGPGQQPIVKGKKKPALTKPRYDVVATLIRAGEAGLSKDALDKNSKHGDARRVLRRLADGDRDWRAVIQFPGTGGMGKHYRIS